VGNYSHLRVVPLFSEMAVSLQGEVETSGRIYQEMTSWWNSLSLQGICLTIWAAPERLAMQQQQQQMIARHWSLCIWKGLHMCFTFVYIM